MFKNIFKLHFTLWQNKTKNKSGKEVENVFREIFEDRILKKLWKEYDKVDRKNLLEIG